MEEEREKKGGTTRDEQGELYVEKRRRMQRGKRKKRFRGW